MSERGVLHRSAAGAAGMVDRAVLPLMHRLFLYGEESPSSERARARAETTFATYASEALVADPRSFHRDPPAPAIETRPVARLRGGAVERWTWRSGYRTWDPAYQREYDDHAENAIVHAEVFRHDGPHDARRIAIVCLHSWATDRWWLLRQAFDVRRFYAAGLDVIVPMLPFHGPRTPKAARFGGQMFPGPDPQRTNEAFGQAVWDVRGVFRGLQGRGFERIGVMGMSLGGYVSALLAWVEPGLAFSIPMVPMVNMAKIIWQHGASHPELARVRARGVTLERLRSLYTIHSPLSLPPLIPHEARLIIAGSGDRICAPDHVNELWEHWARPRIRWFPGGHLAHLGRGAVFREVVRFIREQPPAQGVARNNTIWPASSGRST